MAYQDRWLLPAGISEGLPEEAAHLEYLRRQLLDLYACWGYELVIPPMIEYLDSLLVGTGHTLDLQTFKIIDQLTGRLMGVRADMTSQVARIDAHHLKRDVPTRLCYLDTVLHSRPSGFSSRAPIQLGAEIYGYAGVASDIEMLSLMQETLVTVGVKNFQIDVGHVGIYRSLFDQAQLDNEQHNQLFEALVKRKSSAEVEQLLQTWQISEANKTLLSALLHLNGDASVLAEARQVLASAPAAVHTALDELEQLSQQLAHLNLHFDLAESRGYSYHTGIIFAAYTTNHGGAIAKGGRYDGIGKAFGRERPATGFSTNLRALIALQALPTHKKAAIFAPHDTDPSLAKKISTLRQQGEVVICQLPDQTGDAQAMGCDRQLCLQAGQWTTVPVNA